jgi:hypothetical protein
MDRLLIATIKKLKMELPYDNNATFGYASKRIEESIEILAHSCV